VLHVAGGLDRFLRLAAEPPVAIVGARLASDYGLEVASSLGRDLGAAVVTVVSGMALGIDSAAHGGALAASAPTLAVLPAGADRPYPRSRHALWRRIQAAGAVVSELPPETPVRRWMFPARNRIIAALAAMTVVVQASEHSGALTTAASARELGRSVGAVPGRVNSRLAYGTNKLIADGAVLVRGAQDVLDQVFGAGLRPVPARRTRTHLSPDAVAVLDALGDGADTPAALAHAGFSVERALRLLAWLELDGLVKRGASGRFTPVA
jgi:DNA processing protein